jgi:hypothetical protein
LEHTVIKIEKKGIFSRNRMEYIIKTWVFTYDKYANKKAFSFPIRTEDDVKILSQLKEMNEDTFKNSPVKTFENFQDAFEYCKKLQHHHYSLIKPLDKNQAYILAKAISEMIYTKDLHDIFFVIGEDEYARTTCYSIVKNSKKNRKCTNLVDINKPTMRWQN